MDDTPPIRNNNAFHLYCRDNKNKKIDIFMQLC